MMLALRSPAIEGAQEHKSRVARSRPGLPVGGADQEYECSRMPEDMEMGPEAQQVESEIRDSLEKMRLLVEHTKSLLTGTEGSKA